jgi:hypothetical protein
MRQNLQNQSVVSVKCSLCDHFSNCSTPEHLPRFDFTSMNQDNSDENMDKNEKEKKIVFIQVPVCFRMLEPVLY